MPGLLHSVDFVQVFADRRAGSADGFQDLVQRYIHLRQQGGDDFVFRRGCRAFVGVEGAAKNLAGGDGIGGS